MSDALFGPDGMQALPVPAWYADALTQARGASGGALPRTEPPAPVPPAERARRAEVTEAPSKRGSRRRGGRTAAPARSIAPASPRPQQGAPVPAKPAPAAPVKKRGVSPAGCIVLLVILAYFVYAVVQHVWMGTH